MMDLKIIESCDGCSACCQHMRSPPFIIFYRGSFTEFEDSGWYVDGDYQEEFDRFMAAPIEARRLKWERMLASCDEFPDESPCVWLDQENNRCRYYEHRPDVCMDFDRGCEACIEHRQSKGITT